MIQKHYDNNFELYRYIEEENGKRSGDGEFVLVKTIRGHLRYLQDKSSEGHLEMRITHRLYTDENDIRNKDRIKIDGNVYNVIIAATLRAPNGRITFSQADMEVDHGLQI